MPAKPGYVDHFGQRPLTRFVDYIDAIKVELVHAPDLERMANAFNGVTRACWPDEPQAKITKAQRSEIIDRIVSGRALWQSLEMIDGIIFLISGVTRCFTHQIVRTRIGATFSQQCSGDADWRHHDVAVPRRIWADDREEYEATLLQAKDTYASMMDGKHTSLQECRFLLPHGITTFLYMKCNLAALFPLYAKRTCSCNQSWEMMTVMQKILKAVGDWDSEIGNRLAAQSKCGRGCYQNQCYDKDGEATQLWIPDAQHEHMRVEDQAYVYRRTHPDMAGFCIPALGSLHYHGFGQVEEQEWLKLRKEYGCRSS